MKYAALVCGQAPSAMYSLKFLKNNRLLSGKIVLRSPPVWTPRGLKSSAVSSSSSVNDIKSPRPFCEVPGPNLWDLFKYFRPGGILNGKPILDVQSEFLRRYGNICKIPGLLGKPDIVFVYEPGDMEQIFRSEGSYPMRHLFDYVAYHRNVWRKDFYAKTLGLTIA